MTFMVGTNSYELHPREEKVFLNFIKQQCSIFAYKYHLVFPLISFYCGVHASWHFLPMALYLYPFSCPPKDRILEYINESDVCF